MSILDNEDVTISDIDIKIELAKGEWAAYICRRKLEWVLARRNAFLEKAFQQYIEKRQ